MYPTSILHLPQSPCHICRIMLHMHNMHRRQARMPPPPILMRVSHVHTSPPAGRCHPPLPAQLSPCSQASKHRSGSNGKRAQEVNHNPCIGGCISAPHPETSACVHSGRPKSAGMSRNGAGYTRHDLHPARKCQPHIIHRLGRLERTDAGHPGVCDTWLVTTQGGHVKTAFWTQLPPGDDRHLTCTGCVP